MAPTNVFTCQGPPVGDPDLAFMKTLTGDQRGFMLPILPPSSDATPQSKPFNKWQSIFLKNCE